MSSNNYFHFAETGWMDDASLRAMFEEMHAGNPFASYARQASKRERPPERHVNPGVVKIGKPSRFKTDLLDGAEGFVTLNARGVSTIPERPHLAVTMMTGNCSGETLIPLRRLIRGGAFTLDLSP